MILPLTWTTGLREDDGLLMHVALAVVVEQLESIILTTPCPEVEQLAARYRDVLMRLESSCER